MKICNFVVHMVYNSGNFFCVEICKYLFQLKWYVVKIFMVQFF